MLNLGGAAIPMQINSDEISFLVGNMDILSNIDKVPALPMFSERMMELLSNLSREILKDKRTKKNVDVTSYAYWIRKASLEQAKKKYFDANRIGRGVAFHIAPSNVPVNFAVSMTSSVLAGNATIIRVSNKKFEQVDIISEALNRLLDGEFNDLQPYFCLIRYEHSELITEQLSSVCDLRIIWGGNQTIDTIRKAQLPPRAIEMAFADRHSIVIINSDEYELMDSKKIAKDFYTDTYYTDQNACSSPRLVVWMGSKIEKARDEFWKNLGELVARDYDMKPIQAVDKYTSMCMLAMSKMPARLVSRDNYITRVEVDKLTPELMNYKNGGGYFYEYKAESLEEIVPVLSKQCQTVSVLGIDKNDIKKLVFTQGVRGVDRVVDMGQTMGLEFIWDGYKMIENMTRYVYIGE